MMRFRARIVLPLMLASLAWVMPAQESRNQSDKQTVSTDIDPLALDVLRAVDDPVAKAQAFTFKALIGEEEMADNGQVVTFFHTVDVTVQRPDKIHLIFKGLGRRVDFYGTAGKLTIYSPETKFYATAPAKETIDATVSDLYAKGYDVAIAPFLRDDFYAIAAKAITSAYVIGRSKIFDQDVHQLAFRAADADWQLWVTGGDSPRFVRAEIVNKKLDGGPRTTIQFLDWNLNPAISADEFTFTKPADAVEISLMDMTGGK